MKFVMLVTPPGVFDVIWNWPTCMVMFPFVSVPPFGLSAVKKLSVNAEEGCAAESLPFHHTVTWGIAAPTWNTIIWLLLKTV
jgi:hypothetical protein